MRSVLATVYDYFKKMRARVVRQTHRDARHTSCSVGRGIVPCGKRRGAGEGVMLARGGGGLTDYHGVDQQF